MPEYPVHEAVAAIPEGERITLSSFIDWLSQNGYLLCMWDEERDEWARIRHDPERLMFDFYGLDLNAYRDEKEALYQEMRRQVEERARQERERGKGEG